MFKKYSLKGKILEVGCGDGSLLSQFHQNSNELYGFDISERAIQLAKTKFGDIAFFTKGDILKSHPFSEKKFDVILCSEVLEHIKNDEFAIKTLYEMLNYGGHLIITVPHLNKYWSILDDNDNHVRRYEKDDFESILKKNGFKIYENLDWGYPLFNLYYEHILKNDKKNMTRKISRKSMLKYFLSKMLITTFYFDDLFVNNKKGRNLVLLCKKVKNKMDALSDIHE